MLIILDLGLVHVTHTFLSLIARSEGKSKKCHVSLIVLTEISASATGQNNKLQPTSFSY